MIPERLAALRQEMAKRNIAIYIVPTADHHESEYVGEHFATRKYITGFTGSAGVAVITMTEAGLWTDGRYFVQAAAELEGSTITLYKQGEEGVPTVDEYIEETLQQGEIIGFDGRVVNTNWGERLKAIAEKKEGSLAVDEDLISIIWTDRPRLIPDFICVFTDNHTGKAMDVKCADIRAVMEEKGADIHLLTNLDDIAWVLNIRGGDIPFVPVILSFLVLTKDECIWFLYEEVIQEWWFEYLEEYNIITRPYAEFYDYVKEIEPDKTVLLDKSMVNYRIFNDIPEGVKVIDAENPSYMMKSIKNEVEVENARIARIKDGIVMCRFMNWLKSNVGKIPMSELSVKEYLDHDRQMQRACYDLSFDTICGYAEHGAIIHYHVTKETDLELKPEGLLLVDSGSQYLEGTTDVTRTFALGPVTQEMKTNYTRVLRATLALANAKFLYGCSGVNLDILARQPIWEANLDYRHGTGHGIGHILNVHEGPNGFHWARKGYSRPLEAGQITSDEPGIYIEGAYGIRLENELLCCEGEKNEYGQFMYFENLTLVPYDLDAIDVSQLNETEKAYLNAYHKEVYEKIAPHLYKFEIEWLKEYTREV